MDVCVHVCGCFDRRQRANGCLKRVWTIFPIDRAKSQAIVLFKMTSYIRRQTTGAGKEIRQTPPLRLACVVSQFTFSGDSHDDDRSYRLTECQPFKVHWLTIERTPCDTDQVLLRQVSDISLEAMADDGVAEMTTIVVLYQSDANPFSIEMLDQ